MKSKYIILCLQIVAFKVASCGINEEILDLNSSAIASSVQRGIFVDQERINESLDFAYPKLGQINYEPESFLSLITHNLDVVEHFKHALRHNRLGMFIEACQLLHDQIDASLHKRYALYHLLSKVFKKLEPVIAINKHLFEDRLSEESHITETTGSVLSSDSEEDILSDKSISIFMEYHEEHPIVQKLSIINFDSKAFYEDSFTYFKKQLLSAKLPIRITSNLHQLKMNQIANLLDAIAEIDRDHNLVEIILMNGSSKKFNRMFALLELVYNNHLESNKPISIVFSSTSESQIAYKKLYTLRGVVDLSHSYLDEINLSDSSCPIGIKSPEKKELVLTILEEESANEEKLNQITQKLKDFKQPLIIQTSRNLSQVTNLFEHLTCSS